MYSLSGIRFCTMPSVLVQFRITQRSTTISSYLSGMRPYKSALLSSRSSDTILYFPRLIESEPYCGRTELTNRKRSAVSGIRSISSPFCSRCSKNRASNSLSVHVYLSVKPGPWSNLNSSTCESAVIKSSGRTRAADKMSDAERSSVSVNSTRNSPDAAFLSFFLDAAVLNSDHSILKPSPEREYSFCGSAASSASLSSSSPANCAAFSCGRFPSRTKGGSDAFECMTSQGPSVLSISFPSSMTSVMFAGAAPSDESTRMVMPSVISFCSE